MSVHLRKDMQGLEKALLYLAAQVEEAVRSAVHAFLERRPDIAVKVIEGDDAIDRREVELEEECLKILALHQPVAQDLRYVAACLKIDNDLERIGDLAVNIAERALSVSGDERLRIPGRLREMVEQVNGMVRGSLDAFVAADADGARAVLLQDDEVDRANEKMIERLLVRMHENPEDIDHALEMISVSKNLERIADHATNIAEDVVYLVEGEIIRHRSVGEIAPSAQMPKR